MPAVAEQEEVQTTRTVRTEIQLPSYLPQQQLIAEDGARYKVVRAGRRFGKSRFGLIASTLGHGPLTEPGVQMSRLRKGVAQGGWVDWIAPDYGQAEAIWEEEIVPRFEDRVGVALSTRQRTIRIGKGRLRIRSAENINRLRGGQLDGVVVDEAAYLKLNYAWRRVLRPMLTDRRGWAIFIGTTNIGSDFNGLAGEVEEDERRAADEAGYKRRRPNYKAWHFRTRDNPLLDPEEIDELLAEYPPGSAEALQELDAELLEMIGDLFKDEYFHHYDQANQHAMWIGGVRYPFIEVEIYADLATSLKERTDYTAFTVAGLTAREVNGQRRAGMLDITNERMEAPDQIDRLAALIDQWQPARVLIEATQYQLSAVQHLRKARPRTSIEAFYPKGDKRARAVSFAAAMARSDVFWPPEATAPGWYSVARKQLLKFPNGKKDSTLPEDHDDIVDTGSMLGLRLERQSQYWRPVKVRGR